MKKRAFSLILAVLMVLSVLPVMTLSTGAEEPVATATDFDYDALYVQDGLYSHLSFLEASEANNTADWLSIGTEVSNGSYTFDETKANAELLKYVKLNTASETYTLQNYGTYYYTVNGNATLYPTETDPALLTTDGKISVVTGNTLRFGEGFICSPWHQVGYYQAEGGDVTAFNRNTSSSTLLTSGKELSAHQFSNTILNLPDVETSKDHTVQIVMSVNNRTDHEANKGTNSAYNSYQGHRGTTVAKVSFFNLVTDSWHYGANGYSLTQQIFVRDVAGASWGNTVNLGNLYNIHTGWQFDPSLPTAKIDAAERTANDSNYNYKSYLVKPDDIVGVPYSYTVVSDVLTKTIPAGDDDKSGKNSYYSAKADVKFYYGDVVIGSEYFGRLREDGLLWVPGNDLSADSDWIGNTGGVAIYAIRMYNRALTEDEVLQNRFADIATFYHLDLTNYYAISGQDRVDAIKKFIDSLEKPDLAYETTGSGKTRTSADVVALYEAAFPAAESSGLTYLDFYSYDGLTSMITFYEATEADNTAAWKNMMAAGEDYTDKGANAVLQSYVKVGTKSDYTLNPYGMYYKTVGGNYVLYPTQDDPASATAEKVLEGARGNTFVFGDGYIVNPMHATGWYKLGEADPDQFSGDPAFTVGGVSNSASQLIHTSMNLPKIDHKKDVTVQYVMSLHNRSDNTIVSSWNTDQGNGVRGGDVINNAFFTLQTGSWYTNPSKYEMQYTFKVRHDQGTATWPNDTGNSLYTVHSLATLKYPTTFKQNEEHVPGTAATFTLLSDVFSTEIPEADQAVSGNNKYVAKAHVKLYYNNTVMADDSYFDTLHGGEETWIGAVAANLGASNVGIRGGAAIYAVRTYDRAITEAEMIQNQFADVVGYFHVDPSAMAQIPESAWAQVYPIFKDIKLTDTTVTKASLESTLNEKVKEVKATIKTDLIIFEGYQARYADYNGLRALYTVNEELLAELEAEGFSVEFGAIYAKGADKAIEGEVVDGEFTVDGAEVKTVYRNGMYIGEHFINAETNEKQFTYTVKFEGEDATKANFEEKAQFIAYAVISDGETSEIEYFAPESVIFENAVSLREVAKKYYDNGNGYYRVIQDVLGACGDLEGVTGKTYEINGNNVGDYTIITAPETMKFALELKAAIKEKVGYEIVIADEAMNDGLIFYVGYADCDDGVWAVTYEENTVSLKGHGIEETRAAISAFLNSFPASATEGVYVIPAENIAP